MKLLYTIIVTLVLLFIITFSLSNTEPVHLKYYDFFDVSLASYLLIFISFGIGIIFAGFFGIVERWRLANKVKKLDKSLKKVKKSLNESEVLAVTEEEPLEEKKAQ